MIELYSIKDTARIFAVQESRLRYWMQVGIVGATVRKGGRFYYTFSDLVAVKAAKDLLTAGLSLQKVRKNLESLRKSLPRETNPASRLRICCDGETVVALADDVAFEPRTGQVVMAFNLPALAGHVADMMVPTPTRAGAFAADDAVPAPVDPELTDVQTTASAYRCFLDACRAEDNGEWLNAEHRYLQAVDLQPSLSAAHTNLGNLYFRRGELELARVRYELALDYEPTQAEARYNLANLLEDLGETDLAITEMKRVCATTPAFADAHYNLGVMLLRVGGVAQAAHHFTTYLQLDPQSEWAESARACLSAAA